MKRSQAFLALLLVVSDVLMASLSFYLAYRLNLRMDPTVGGFLQHLPVMMIFVSTLITVFFFNRLYHRRRVRSQLDEFVASLGAVTLGALIAVAVISFILRNTLDYRRPMILFAWLLSLALITVGRALHARLQRKLLQRGLGNNQVVLVGAGEVARMVLQKMLHSPHLGYQPLGLVDVDSGPRSILGFPVLGKVADLPRIIEANQVDEVIICLPEASHRDLIHIISLCERERVSIRIYPDVFQIMASEISISDLGGMPLLTMRDVALRGWHLALKRGMDIAGSMAGLILLSPLMMLTALLIKLESPGPVFYMQERMGLDAKPFRIIKFRSMRADAEAKGPGWTTPDDPRRTRLGAFIRRFSLDELPQLINVLTGDMSLVGPRPERPVYVEQFRQSIPRYMDRHREKAGITGWAQVNGLRGDTSIAERTKYDLWYIENWSLGLDFIILLRTIVRAISDRHAY